MRSSKSADTTTAADELPSTVTDTATPEEQIEAA